jgi:hypothetical protein
MGGYIGSVSGQRLGKNVPVATVKHAAGENGIVVHAVRTEELKKENLGNQ